MKRAIGIIVLTICLAGNGALRADDTEIYGTISIDVQPNVLIIFDNSGSMSTEDVPGDPYDPATTYTGSFSTNAVYYKALQSWNLFASDVNSLNCASVKSELLTKGFSYDRIRPAARNYTCGGTKVRLRTGNYMNYEESGVGAPKARIDVAKEVVSHLINVTNDVRFGVMIFNTDQGGRVLQPCGTDKTTLVNSVNGLNASTWTPLAETLAEAGLYFAGKQSWFNSGVTYTTPMQERCQKNYIIIMTDGEPTKDNDTRLVSGTYINGDTIGDYDGDGNDPGSYSSDGTDYLDDVAKYLYENDCHPTLGTGTSFVTQNIVTYTIGFRIENQLLEDTATNGGGEYYTAQNVTGLSEAFEHIMSTIIEVNAVFVSPVVPVSRMNRTFAGNQIYVGFFKPQQDGRWLGNIKKYGLGSSGQMLDADGKDATMVDGTIKENVRSYWSISADGANVTEGGVGDVLLGQASRNIYTYMATQASLVHNDNQFSTTNALLTNDVLNVGSDTERQSLINDVLGQGRSWLLGDIIHSQPAVIHHDSDADGSLDSTYIFSGSNDGMIHCFNDSDGSELWGFIPPDQLGRLNLFLNTDHDYFVDGAPVVYQGSSRKILFFGERRGGDHYYALDITNPAVPSWLYKIDATLLGTAAGRQLGQSWCRPVIGRIKTSSNTSEDVFLLGGGYDNNQDLSTPATGDTIGRAVFALKITTGTVVSNINFNGSNDSDMTHSIVDVTGFDSNGSGYLDTIYVGDLGGQIFAFEDHNGDGTWSRRKLFEAPVTDGRRKKIFCAPDAVSETFGQMIFFGTGDRADPGETNVENRVYAIKNTWADSSSFTTITEADLVDVTADLIQLGSAEAKIQTRTQLESAKGWYIRLENSGEKVTATPVVFGGVVYFTTYAPSTDGGSTSGDPCGANTARGNARLYAVDYLTGASVKDYCDEEETDADGEVVELGKKDRWKRVGTAIPSAPVIAVLESGPKLYLGVEGGVAQEDPKEVNDMNVYYWRQIFF